MKWAVHLFAFRLNISYLVSLLGQITQLNSLGDILNTSYPAQRTNSFAQNYSPSWVDRFGVWLSARQIRKWVPNFRDKSVADIGCGFHASFSRTLLHESRSITLADLSISAELKSHSRVVALEGELPGTLAQISDSSEDVLMCMSVVEHLWEPQKALNEFYRILKPGGVCLINVPSWKGKKYLEYSAFVLGFSPEEEMQDHKMYYDVKDLWPMLVRSGFRPKQIQCFLHKFGLNCFAVCTKAN